MTRVLFIGGFVPREMMRTVVEDTYGKVQFSNHNFEMSLIRGLAAGEDVELRAISAPKVYSYPHNNRNRVIRAESYEDNGVSFSSIGYNNRTGINLITRTWQLMRGILRELSAFGPGSEEVKVVINTPALEYTVAARMARMFTSRPLKMALVVPDVPECLAEMNGGKSLKMRIVGLLNRLNRFFARRIGRMVYLTEAMNDYYNLPADRWIVMEGLIDEERVKRVTEAAAPTAGEAEKEAGGEVILYTGTLRRIFGVMDLVDMFERGGFDNCELRICGSGEAEEELRERAARNPAIKFLGSLSPEEALKEQSRATILVNPRNSAGNYTRYSFPSKTIEYLLTGRTVVANRLPGIPREYDAFIHYPASESADSWIECLREVMAMDPEARKRHDDEGRAFILARKTARAQASRILDLLKDKKT
ncbi:MAG: glycosyltransferase [Muribaculaceae bacterium]|nr:glycosyltransferase [Muribaculaceae bacterium]